MVKNLLAKLGGTNLEDLGDKTAISEDHTLTWGAMLDATGNLAATEASKTLAASGFYDNGGSTAAENFNVAVGANGTVNLGSTTAIYVGGKYSLSDIFNLTTASYDSISFSVASQETEPTAMSFNTSGTKMYVLGQSGSDVNQYTLTTGFDISTASFDSVTFSFASQDTNCEALFFNSDGSKMYMGARVSNDVFEYDLGTNFVVSSAVYNSVSFNPSSMSNLKGISFNPDGTKLYIADAGTDDIREFVLTTGFDLSTAVDAVVAKDVSSQELSVSGVYFSNIGDKMFIVGSSNDTVFQYDLTTNFDITTASYASISFSISSQESTPTDLFFNSDGSKMYIVGDAGNRIYQYSTGSGSAASGSFVLCDTNTLAINSETNAFCLDWTGTFPTGTSGSFDLIDYFNFTPSGVDEDSTLAATTNTYSDSSKSGIEFTVNENRLLTEFECYNDCNATIAYLMDDNDNILAQSNISTFLATFNYTLQLGFTYRMAVDNGGSSYTVSYRASQAPTTYGEINFITGFQSLAIKNLDRIFGCLKFTTQSVVTSPNQTINLPVNSVTGKTGVVAKGALTNVSNMIIKAKLVTTDTSVTPTIERWGIVKL